MTTSTRNRMPARELLPLIGISVAAFIFNVSEFMPVGLLVDIGQTFDTSDATTGMLISVYAWAVMLLSLPLMIWASRIAFKPLVLGLLFVFAAGQVFSALSPTYETLMAARLVVACAHSIFWAIAAPVAVRVVDMRHASLAVAMVEMGAALAMTVGLPLGRVIGLVLGWRQTFALISACGFLCMAFLAFVFPKIPAAKPFTLKQMPSILQNKALVGIFIVTALFAMGYYVAYSYIEPYFLEVSNLDSSFITGVLVVFGIFGIFGSWLCARFYSQNRKFFALWTIFGVLAALLLMCFCSASPVVAVFVCALWGMSNAGFSMVYQAEIIRFAKDCEQTVAMAIFSGIYNLGIGSGSFIGGIVCANASISLVGFVGGAIVAVALVYCACKISNMQKKRY